MLYPLNAPLLIVNLVFISPAHIFSFAGDFKSTNM